jgi:aspartyl/asparaginyl beta-hydroxylase (cupin superfamily)
MATPQEALDILPKINAIREEVETLRAEARVLKKQHDAIVRKATLKHKLGGFNESDKELLKEIMTPEQ